MNEMKKSPKKGFACNSTYSFAKPPVRGWRSCAKQRYSGAHAR